MLNTNNQDRVPVIPCENPSGIVVFDLETTGLDPERDEILQIAALDGDGNILINTYVKPTYTQAWPDAENINGISPQIVADKPQIKELLPSLLGIFQSARELVSYNGWSFDMWFLEAVGISVQNIPHFDVMHEFAPIYGEWSDYHQSYRWQSLSICAHYYNYQFQAHDALEDCKATLYCCKQIRKAEKEKEVT